jgi:transposase InsO family protein
MPPPTGVPRSTAGRRAHRRTPTVREATAPANALSEAERERVRTVLNSEEFVDQAPTEVYATLLGRGEYLCSPATMYRILAADAQVRERRRQARHPARTRPELIATGPGQVYTWDITKLAGPVKGCYYDAYVMIDIYSRYIVGAHVHARESGPLAQEMIEEVFGVHGIPHVVHADRGTSMTSKTVATLLSDLNVTRSHSRPRVSNDNPYSEAWFKTLKYAPEIPRPLPIPGRRPRLPHRVRRLVQPRPPPRRDRPAHPRRRPLRPGRHHGRPANRHPRRSPSSPPRTLLHHHRPQDPRPPADRLDQQARRPARTGRLTPTGLNHLDKFRAGADSTGRRNTSMTEVCGGGRTETFGAGWYGVDSRSAAAVGGGSGVADADALARASGAAALRAAGVLAVDRPP